jgi:hypothetical protein
VSCFRGQAGVNLIHQCECLTNAYFSHPYASWGIAN